MGVPTRNTIIDGLNWLDKTDLGDKAATICRQAMQWAETGEAADTLERFFEKHRMPGSFASLDSYRGYYDRVNVAFFLMDKALETFGKEYVPWKTRPERGFAYLNTGDTYAPTIIFDFNTDTWRVASWGDLVESRPGRY
jgi:hypothetical protein